MAKTTKTTKEKVEDLTTPIDPAQECNNEKPAVDVEALLKAQEEKFNEILKAQKEENAKQIELLTNRNNELAEELTNLKTNTAEENELLGQKIAEIKGDEVKPKFDPYAPDRLYKVYNEVAGITTVMTGDEVEGIVGSIDKHLTEKLQKGAKTIDKHPYKITFYRKTKIEG